VDQTVDKATGGLLAWIGTVLPDTPTAVKSAGDNAAATGAVLRLVDIVPVAVPRAERAPLVVRLDYLITLHLADPLAEHRALGELVFAAMARPDIELATADSTALRERLKLTPFTGLTLSMRLPRERAEEQAKLVRQLPIIHASPVRALEGVVLGPSDFPIMEAIVEVPALRLTALTGPEGRFRFEAMPAGGKPVRVSARKLRTKIEVDAVPGQSLTIRMPLES
jgi:hypothetical protein